MFTKRIPSARVRPCPYGIAGQYAATVTSDDLTREQAHKLTEIVRRHLIFLGRLRTRMERLGFPQSDPMYLYTCRAYDAVHAMHTTAQSASVKSGVGRPEKA